ncbi:MAG: sigma 54-interacting transcriptional regulator [Sandaracinus sp.]
MSPAPLVELSDSIRTAPSFDDAARALLAFGRRAIEETLGRPLARGLVHVRSDATGYRALFRDEWRTGGRAGSIAPSATVFGLLEREHGGVALDLRAVRGLRIADGASLDVARFVPAFDAGSSVHQLLSRNVTHVVAQPLPGARGEVLGMVCFEAEWPTEIGRPLDVASLRDLLALGSQIAAPRLVALADAAPAPVTDATPDALLPVVGARMRAIVEMLRLFAEQDETLLLSGPTGAGKSRLAAWCHARSPRASRPFETANLLALPESLQMGELFGWRRGAFTGATSDHAGLVSSADRGTLFLDEIDKLSLSAQAGLLRFLETRRFLALGASKEEPADVRVVVGTNADLRALVKSGAFREDLYYRIHVLPVRVPSLDERRDEIAGWAEHFLARRHASSGAGGTARIEPAGLSALSERKWPGNLRQLDNVVRRAYALACATPGAPVVTAAHVARALSVEGDGEEASTSPPTSTIQTLTDLAERIVDDALAARRHGLELGTEDLDVLRGAVLRAAAERLGSVKDAYLLFGATSLVETRNHTKSHRRELGALEATIAKLAAIADLSSATSARPGGSGRERA